MVFLKTLSRPLGRDLRPRGSGLLGPPFLLGALARAIQSRSQQVRWPFRIGRIESKGDCLERLALVESMDELW